MHEHPIDFAPSRFLGLDFVPSWTFEIQIGDEINNQSSADQTYNGWSTQSRGRFDGIKSTCNSVDALVSLNRLYNMNGTGPLTSPKMIVVIAASRSRVPTPEYGTAKSMVLFCRILIHSGIFSVHFDLNIRMWVTISASSPTPQKIYLSLAPMEVPPKAV
jgi:hypothetical protein